MTTVTTKTISKDYVQGQQSVELHEVLKLNDHKIRIIIDSDSYKFQCSAVVDVFHPTELKWNRLAYIHYNQMSTPAELVYYPEIQRKSPPSTMAKYFEKDRTQLLKLAKEILL